MNFNKILKLSFSLLVVAGLAVPQLSANDTFKSKCGKCHKLNGVGKDKGPDLTHFASKRSADYLKLYSTDPAGASAKYPADDAKRDKVKYSKQMGKQKVSADELSAILEAMK